MLVQCGKGWDVVRGCMCLVWYWPDHVSTGETCGKGRYGACPPHRRICTLDALLPCTRWQADKESAEGREGSQGCWLCRCSVYVVFKLYPSGLSGLFITLHYRALWSKAGFNNFYNYCFSCCTRWLSDKVFSVSDNIIKDPLRVDLWLKKINMFCLHHQSRLVQICGCISRR